MTDINIETPLDCTGTCLSEVIVELEIFDAEGDAVRIETDQAAVGNGDPVRVARQVTAIVGCLPRRLGIFQILLQFVALCLSRSICFRL